MPDRSPSNGGPSEPRRLLRWALVAANVAAAAFLFHTMQQSVSVAGLLRPAARVDLEVPDGFVAGVFAGGLAGPRLMTVGPDGFLYVAERGNERIVALADTTGDGVADVTRVFASGVSAPNSVTWHRGALYVGVPTGVVELRDEDADGQADRRRVLVDDYPTSGHSTRTVLFLPDGRMVVSVGSSCNVCIEDDPRRATLVVYDGPDAGGEKVFATGLRNAVGLALHPRTGKIWATNNGRDWLGDDLPPETVNIVEEGDDFGWPRCHAGDIVDPDYGRERGCDGVKAPAVRIQAHSAPIGLAFYTGSAFPDGFHGDLFVAYRGSWNRSVPTGYKVVRVDLGADGSIGRPEDFATGFATDDGASVRGRPVDVAVGPDGALYISDEKAGYIYRVAWAG